MATLKLPRLSLSSPIVSATGFATQQLVRWWNEVCLAIEGAINTLSTQEATLAAQEATLQEVLGIANDASATAGGVVAVVAGISQLPAHSVLLGEGAKPIAGAAPGAAGGVLTSTGTTSDPTFQTLSAAMDTAFGVVQGTVIFRGAAGWQGLGPSTAGLKLTTNGAGADPSWT